jgi:glucokinase
MTHRTVVGVDLGGTNVRAARVAGADGIVAHKARTISSMAPEQTVVDEVAETIAAVMEPDVAGIGIGVPSVVDVDRGIVYSVENIPSWKEVPLGDLLTRRFGVPVLVNNDANCFAVGEYYFGHAQGFRNVVGMVVGTGLGAGVIVNGKLYCGTNCGAGELGAMPYKGQTVEYYCSGTVFADFGRDMGDAVMMALYAFDPEVLVLGGSVSQSFEFFAPAMRERLKAYAYPHALERLVLKVSAIPDVAILGAAGLCYDAGQ